MSPVASKRGSSILATRSITSSSPVTESSSLSHALNVCLRSLANLSFAILAA